MTFDEWIEKEGGFIGRYGTLRTLVRAFDAGVEEGLRQAAEKEARKKPTGLILNTDESGIPDGESKHNGG